MIFAYTMLTQVELPNLLAALDLRYPWLIDDEGVAHQSRAGFHAMLAFTVISAPAHSIQLRFRIECGRSANRSLSNSRATWL
jgi:hypothetical protein